MSAAALRNAFGAAHLKILKQNPPIGRVFMGAYAQNYLKMLHRQSIGNKARLADAKDCGCFSCLSHFPASAAEYWDDEGGETAVCPKCGIDSVIGEHDDERVSDDLLRAMNERYF